MHVRALQPSDESVWRDLWAQYVAFYQADVADTITDVTWNRLIGPDPAMFTRVVTDGSDSVVGFANVVVHPATWTIEPACYLEDLFVLPESRGGGYGRALLEDLLALAKDADWSRVYWHTDAANTTARRLYDQFSPADQFVRYRLLLDQKPRD